VEVKNCAPFVFESNRAAVPPLDTVELTLPKYFDSFYPDWNYVQIQNLTNLINSGVEATKGAKINQRLPMKQITFELYSPLFVGVSPGGCVDSISSSIPAHNPEHLIFNSLPCTVGVYMSGQFKDKSYGSPLVSTFTVSGPTAEEIKAAADKEVAELKAKQDAEAKAAAELKARQEAAVKAAAELKAKQDAEAKAAAELKSRQEAAVKAAAELKAKQEADAKAAAELKAKQEADAKAAAELKAKQDAAADKVALARAQSELAAANAALADSQKVNRELQTQLNSVDAQFKVLSDSVSVIQGQVSQLNSKLAAALAGQNTANAKLKKVCSAKPKPKGC